MATPSLESLMDKGNPNEMFELVREQAVGSFGTVYLAARRDNPESVVALKIISISEGKALILTSGLHLFEYCDSSGGNA